MHDAAGDLRRRQRRRYNAFRIDRFEPLPFKTSAKRVEKPPGHAIHDRDNMRACVHQRRQRLGCLYQRRSFQADEQQVLRTERAGLIGRVDSGDIPVLALHDAQAIALYGVKMRPARQEVHCNAGTRQASRDDTANGAPANHGDFDGLLIQIYPLYEVSMRSTRRMSAARTFSPAPCAGENCSESRVVPFTISSLMGSVFTRMECVTT